MIKNVLLQHEIENFIKKVENKIYRGHITPTSCTRCFAKDKYNFYKLFKNTGISIGCCYSALTTAGYTNYWGRPVPCEMLVALMIARLLLEDDLLTIERKNEDADEGF